MEETLDVIEFPSEGRYAVEVGLIVPDSLFNGDGLFEVSLSDTAGNSSTFAAAFSLDLAFGDDAYLNLVKGDTSVRLDGSDILQDQLSMITWCNSLPHIPSGFDPVPITDHYCVHLSENDTYSAGAGLNIEYDESLLSGVEETSLALFRWDGPTLSWIQVDGSVVSTELDVVSASILEGGTYAVFATAVSDDELPPHPINDLGGVGVPRGNGHVDLDWTAPRDDLRGQVVDYVLAYSPVPFSQSDWAALPKIRNLADPGEPGEHEVASVVLPEGGQRYYVAIRAKDAAANLAPWATSPRSFRARATRMRCLLPRRI